MSQLAYLTLILNLSCHNNSIFLNNKPRFNRIDFIDYLSPERHIFPDNYCKTANFLPLLISLALQEILHQYIQGGPILMVLHHTQSRIALNL